MTFGKGETAGPEKRWRCTDERRRQGRERGVRTVKASEKWAHLPEELLQLLRVLRDKAAARVRATRERLNAEARERAMTPPPLQKNKGEKEGG